MRSLAVGVSVLVVSGAALVACGSEGSSGTAKKCAAAKGEELVVLADDKKLQTVDNIIPAVYRPAATPALVAALDKVSAALDTPKLIRLNRQVDVERKTAANVAAAFVAGNGLTSGLSGGSGAIQVGAANFGESKILANIYATVLTAAGFHATVKEVGNRELYLRSLSKGEIDVMPEYVGTLTEFLNKQQNGPKAAPKASADLAATLTALKELGAKASLAFGAPAQAADQNAFAVTKAYADANGLRTLSDLAARCNGGELVLGGPTECKERPFCQPGLERTYGLRFTGFQTLDSGGPLTKTALRQGRVELGLVLSSDGSLSG
ncbi:MAG TPA: glycine betaine ABC transporter substrate-binding protein [Mycobacteriales bacterium]|nr:glycine betaine ABC transporter substrate-binding protein [Mycobacteriales bacterium]